MPPSCRQTTPIRSDSSQDLRNHGASPHHPRHDYTALAEDIEGFLAEHGLRNPTLIGHSMGAKAVMAVALRDPARVEALVSIDNAPVDAALASDFGTYVAGMRKVEEAAVRKQSDADEILQGYVEVRALMLVSFHSNMNTNQRRRFLARQSLPVRQFLLTNLHRPPGSSPGTPLAWRIPLRTLGGALGAMADFPFKGDAHARFEGPALFVRGTKSKYVADDVLPVIGRFFPRFRLADVEAGHWIVSENPEAFREAVVEFLGLGE